MSGEFGENGCKERHDNCTGRMDSHSREIKSKLPSKTFYWVAGVMIAVILGGYKYTHTVEGSVHKLDKDIQHVVTKDDMKEYQKQMVEAIKEAIK